MEFHLIMVGIACGWDDGAWAWVPRGFFFEEVINRCL